MGSERRGFRKPFRLTERNLFTATANYNRIKMTGKVLKVTYYTDKVSN